MPDQSPLPATEWIRRNCSILVPGSGVQPIEPYPYQERLWDDRARQRIVLKSRQMGVSRALACEAAWRATTCPGATILFVSRSLQAARNLLRYTQQSIAPAVQEGRIVKPSSRNTTQIEWEKQESRIVSLAASMDAARSYSATAVYLDEAAYLPWAEEIYQALAPTVSAGGIMTVVSTPHGRGNLFHRLWECEEDWSRHRVHWSERPEYTPEWAERERKRHTGRSWAEEYELSFESSGLSVFLDEHLRAILMPGPAEPCAPFFGGLDLARYTDYTALAILDHRGMLVGLERFNLAGWTVQVERVVAALARFPGCSLVCDASGVGDPVAGLLQARAASSGRAFSVQPFVYTSESRSVLMDDLVLAVEQQAVRIPDPSRPNVPEPFGILLGEMEAFQWDTTAGGRAVPRHPSGGHDDCVQALALAWKALQAHRARRPRLTPALIAIGTADGKMREIRY